MRALFITGSDFSDTIMGGVKCSSMNHLFLSEYFEVDVICVKKRSSLKSAIDAIFGYFPPADKGYVKEVKDMLHNNEYQLVFFDGSSWGDFMDVVEETEAKRVVFFHNCEHDYLRVRLGGKKTFKRALYQRAIDRSEQRCIRRADVCIALTSRDAERISYLYGRKPEFILPITLVDQYKSKDQMISKQANSINTDNQEIYFHGSAEGNRLKNKCCLLFGPLSTANLEAFEWFAKNVSPRLKCKTLIAGKGLEKYKKLEEGGDGKISVIGFVEDISELYRSVSCVAIPLLSGAGMKIKTAEAMMFGKYIFGTREAFVGYQADFDKLGGLCESADDFIKQINAFIEEDKDPFNQYARIVYEKRYSMDAGREKFKEIMESLGYVQNEQDLRKE